MSNGSTETAWIVLDKEKSSMELALAFFPIVLVILGGALGSVAQVMPFKTTRSQKLLSWFGILLSSAGGLWSGYDSIRGGGETLSALHDLVRRADETANRLEEALGVSRANLELTQNSVRETTLLVDRTKEIEQRSVQNYRLASDIANIVNIVNSDNTGGYAFPFVYLYHQVGGASRVPTRGDLAWAIRGGRVLHDLELEMKLPVSLRANGQWDFETLERLEVPELWSTVTPSANLLNIFPKDLHRPLYLLITSRARNGSWDQALLLNRLPNRFLTWRAEVRGFTITEDGRENFRYEAAAQDFPPEERTPPLLPLDRDTLDSLGVPERQGVLKDWRESLSVHGPYPE